MWKATEKEMSILIVKLSAIGDCVLALPFLYFLEQRFPQAAIDWVVEEKAYPLLARHSRLRKVFLFPKSELKTLFSSHSYRAFFTLLKKSLGALRAQEYALAFDLQGNWRSQFVLMWVRSKKKVGFANPREGFPWLYTERVLSSSAQHALDRNLSLLSPFGLPEEAKFSQSPPPRWYAIPPSSQEQPWKRIFAASSAPLILIHPGASKKHKRWPALRFAALSKLFIEQWGAQIVLVGAKNEFVLAQHIVNRSRLPIQNLCQKLALDELAQLCRQAALFIGHDTGCTHLAAAVGCPALALFGPTDPAKTSPRGERVSVLQHKFPCSPCFSEPICSNRDCLLSLTVEEVFQSAASLLKRYAPLTS